MRLFLSKLQITSFLIVDFAAPAAAETYTISGSKEKQYSSRYD